MKEYHIRNIIKILHSTYDTNITKSMYLLYSFHQILLICYPGFLGHPVHTIYVRSRPTSISRVCRRVDTRKYMDTPVRKGVGIPHGAVASTHCTMQSALSAKSAALFFTFCFFPPHLRLVSRFFILSLLSPPPFSIPSGASSSIYPLARNLG